jgi:ferritin-like protein
MIKMNFDVLVKGITKDTFIDLLIEDTMNEYKHMLFYLNAGCHIQGLAREEIGEFLAKEARDEMNHVEAFTKVVIELGGGDKIIERLNQVSISATYQQLRDVKSILQRVLAMEEEVVERYTKRSEDAASLGGVDGRYVEIFLEDQILDSKSTAAHVRQMLVGL